MRTVAKSLTDALGLVALALMRSLGSLRSPVVWFYLLAPAAAAFSSRLAPLPAQTANRVWTRLAPRETCITPPPSAGRIAEAISLAVRGAASVATRPDPTRGSLGAGVSGSRSNAGSS